MTTRSTVVYAILAAAALVGALVVGWALRDAGAREETAAVQRTVEQERARREGLVIASAEREQTLQDRLTRLAGERSSLTEQLDAARRAAPPARPVRVADLTGDATAGGLPREEKGGDCPVAPATGSAPSPAGASPPCLLAAGDGVRLVVSEIDLVSDAGTRIVVGTGELWRTSPPPRTLLATAPLRGSVGVEPPRPCRSRWAASADVGVSTVGWVYAGAVERRVAGPVWAGLAAGAHGSDGFVSGRVRVEW